MTGFAHVVRRAVQEVQDGRWHGPTSAKGDNIMDMDPVLMGVLIAIGVFFSLILTSFRYTYGEVVSSLAMIEQPTTTVVSEYRRVAESADPDAPLEKAPLLDEEVVVIKEEPITRSLRRSLKHITNVGGFRARWRGLTAAIMYALVSCITMHLLTMLFMGLAPLAYIVSSVLISRLHMTWTHIMITPPSDKPWYRRIPKGRRVFRFIALPAFVYAAAQQLTVYIPMFVFFLAFGYRSAKPDESIFVPHLVSSVITAAASGLLCAFCILLPAAVTLTRVEASLLPEDQETIVSFDRTFNGVVPSAISFDEIKPRKVFVEAWRSFDRSCRDRIIRFYVKYLTVQTLIVLTGVAASGAAIAIAGYDKLPELVLRQISPVNPETGAAW